MSGLSQYVGLWEYADEDIWLMVYDDETWEFLNEQGVAVAFGSLVMDEDGITLYFDDTGETVMQLGLSASGDLLDSESGGVLVPAESTYYFTRNGLEINAGVDMGTYLLEDGVCSYATEDGSGYSTGDCYWEVIKNYDETSDGIREIQFDAICYIPRSSLGDFDGKYNCNVYHQLYDFYTGKWFTRSSAYKNSTRGDDYYVHSVEWNGQSDIIEYTRSSDWQSNVGEWAKVLTVDYHVYMPEGYDGLVLVNAPQPDNYEAFEIFNSQHTTFSEASIMEIDLLEPYGCLFFNVCDGVS